ncbi:MAG: ribonuclease HI [bacterium]|nr:ribonuclease HI [bacterium]
MKQVVTDELYDLPTVNSELILYTDGSCSRNPGPGGWAAVLIHIPTGKQLHLSGGEPKTTNNRMEITAILSAVQELKRPSSLTIFTDSMYVVNAFKSGWLTKWQRNGWRTLQGKAVENIDLWQALLKALEPHRVEWQHVRGHAGTYYNELCDQMARLETAEQQNRAGQN